MLTLHLAVQIDKVGMVREHQHVTGTDQSVEHLQTSRRARTIDVEEEVVGNERQRGVSFQLAVDRRKSHWALAALPAVLAPAADYPDGLHPETG